MMKRNTLFLAIILCSMQAVAGGIDKNDWNPGEIVLRNGNRLSGQMQYDLEQNVAILKNDGKMRAFSVYNVDYFRILDNERKTVRSFYTMPYTQDNGQERYMFFELVFKDNFALFNREHTTTKQQAMIAEMPYVNQVDSEDKVKVFTYYVFTPDGEFQKIYTEERDVARKLSLNKQERRDMMKYIHENNLNLNNRSDFIRLIYEFV